MRKKRRHHHNNRSKQLNPNNESFWRSRGYQKKPFFWKIKSKFIKFKKILKNL